ncbi:MAG TPA: methyl-accepting chemotaxis protein, partial [Nevskiaceae bacterium]|nr:methyl-accepting chemotaxis protein [Nevskiaceae bacterium]
MKKSVKKSAPRASAKKAPVKAGGQAANDRRIRAGVEKIATNLMVADVDLTITYANPSVLAMLRAAQSDIRRDLPHFDADRVLGANIDIFHKHPEHQRRMLSTLDHAHNARIKVGGRTFALNLSPIRDAAGKPDGFIVEWKDMTEELKTLEAEKSKAAGFESQLAAISKAQAVIEFTLDGKIVHANENFLGAMGYSMDEIRGQHHGMFVDPAYRSSADYRAFWEKLGRGEYDAGQYKRIAKGGREIWIQASYNPILDGSGKPCKVVKYATDITEQKMKSADYEGQLSAISKAQAVIEFTLEGKIIQANENFLNAMGYRAEEIRGQHHSMFVDPAFRSSTEYRLFWEKLGRGEYDSGQYKRVAKGGREIWIQASYNPILDLNGKPFKVVKYATDVTEQVKAQQVMQQAVAQTQEVVGATKDGDLTRRIPMEGKTGSIEQLCGGVNSLVDSFASIVGRIKVAVDTISTAAKEIASGNTDLSARTEQQAASLEETASSMEELTSTVKQNAENAKQANQLAIGAGDVAQKGGKVVSEVVTTMAAINESSKKIVDIISVIDGIAFQTNILALNAAVEAARAGEQGRGFAVVAAEVRSLAQRSAGAAKEIKSLIGDSVEKVGNGAKLVEQAGKTMDEIVGSVKRVTDIMAEISAASQEQSSGIEQVNQTITQMDEVTQQNAALVEEASASARSLEEQSIGLTHSVSQFKLDESAIRALPAAPASAPVAAARPAAPAARTPARP